MGVLPESRLYSRDAEAHELLRGNAVTHGVTGVVGSIDNIRDRGGLFRL
jgi:hypothetical protein